MNGIARPITLDRRHIAKHLPNTLQSQRLLKLGRAAHTFIDEDTMNRVAQTIIEYGEYNGKIRNYERYGLFFTEPIGYRISADGSTIPLFYGEVKIDADNRYHVIPRTKPSEG
jgi:effector-binding domain-containing protein